MRTPLVLYEALLQASVPATAARAVAEALETDMTSQLATKQDLLAIRQDIKHLEERSDLKLAKLEEKLDIRFAHFETRVVVKLGTLTTVLLGATATLLTLLR